MKYTAGVRYSSRRAFRRWTLATWLASAILLLAASGNVLAQDANSEPQRGGSITSAIPTTGIRGFASWQDTTGNETHVYTAVFDTFVRYDDEYEISGGLIQSWESQDSQSWVFSVREDVVWHDGVALTARDFIDYINTVLDPASAASSETVDLYAGAVVELIDEHTFSLELPSANAALLDGFTAQWLTRTRDFDPNRPIGTGPFQFVEWRRNQFIHLERNESYWRAGLPYIDELRFVKVPDASTRIAMLLAGEVNVARSVPMAEVERLANHPAVTLIETPPQFSLSFWYLLTKASVAPFDNVLVRQAINHAIDREALLDVTFGRGGIRSNPVGEGSWAFNPNAASYNVRNVELARELMAEAGYAPGREAFSVTLKYWQEWPENSQISQIIQANLAEIGIRVQLELVEIGQWVDSVLYDYDYQMALTALVPRWDPHDQLGNAYRTDDGAALEWHSPAFDEAWSAGAASSDQAERQRAYWLAQEIALNEVPATILNSAPAFDAAAVSIHGLVRYNRGDLFYERAWVVND